MQGCVYDRSSRCMIPSRTLNRIYSRETGDECLMGEGGGIQRDRRQFQQPFHDGTLYLSVSLSIYLISFSSSFFLTAVLDDRLRWANRGTGVSLNGPTRALLSTDWAAGVLLALRDCTPSLREHKEHLFFTHYEYTFRWQKIQMWLMFKCIQAQLCFEYAWETCTLKCQKI